MDRLNQRISVVENVARSSVEFVKTIAIKTGIPHDHDVFTNPFYEASIAVQPRPPHHNEDMEEDYPEYTAGSSFDFSNEKEDLAKLEKPAIIDKFIKQSMEVEDLHFKNETMFSELEALKIDMREYQKEIAKLTNLTQTFASQVSNLGPSEEIPNPIQ